MLLRAGADPNAKDSQGRTAAQLADHYRQGDWSEICDRLKAASASNN
jgi:ankyrin repeat protein